MSGGIGPQDGINRLPEIGLPSLSPHGQLPANVSRMSRTRRRTAAFALAPALALATLTSSPVAAVASGHQSHRQHALVRHHALPSWQLKPVDTVEQFRGLDPVSHNVAWVGGSDGSVFRTVNGGDTWANVSPPDTTGLLFRDVEAFDRNHAVILAIGNEPPDASRIYRTDDGGQTWTQTFTNTDPSAFYDCMAFSDRRHGLALSDPVDGKFRVIATRNGGRSWTVRSTEGMPDALTGEFAFAASGTCLTTSGKHDAWFGTGGGAQARVFHSRNGGKTWTVAATPMLSTEAGGIFSLAFRDRHHGFAIGGDFAATGEAVDALAVTRNGGRTWHLVPAEDAPDFYRSGSAFVQITDRRNSDRSHGWLKKHGSHASLVALAVGPTGSDISFDGGNSWTAFDPASGGFDAVECAGDGSCWASEKAGKVARLAFPHHQAARH
jgi:photosystem II stability/assembly factor-like uncharacterized protein